MEEYSVKRTGNGLVAPRRGLREAADSKDKNVQYCPRLGCSGRVNYKKSTRVGGMEKPRPLRPNFGSSNGKEVVGSSSMTSSGVTSARRSCKESHRKSSSIIENKLSDTRSLNEDPEVLKQLQSSTEHQFQFDSAKRDTGSSSGSSKVLFAEVGCSSGTSSSRARKIFGQGPGSSNQKSPMDSSVSSSSKSISTGTRGSSSSGEGYRLRNLKCNSVSDTLPYSYSPSESSISRRDTVKRRNIEGESSSSSKGKKMSGASRNEGRAIRPATGISISDSRSSRSSDFSEGNHAVSVRTRRSMNVSTRLRGSIQDSLHTKSSSGLSQNLPEPGTTNVDMPSSSSQFFTGSSSSDYSAYSLPGNDDDDDDDDDEDEDLPGVVPFTSAEIGIDRFMNREAFQRYNMDGVAQVLLALERIEQDEELSYERLLALESNLFLSGLNFYDQHRDMRLDIDDMSYEELLALGERIGSVNTALPEEALLKCLRRSIYQGMASEPETLEADGDGDDVKCSICQEEYVIGDEIGNLGCEHGYHTECIKQWFKLKNWCPICKAAAGSPKTPS